MNELKKFKTAHSYLINDLNYSLEEFKRFIKTDIELELLPKISDEEIQRWYSCLHETSNSKAVD